MRKLLIAILASVLMVSCGQKHQAKSVVNKFLDENLKKEYDFTTDFDRLASTNRISNSTVTTMQQQALGMKHFKNSIHYGEPTEPLYYMRVKLMGKSDTLKFTFYLDKDLKHVVALKEN